MTAARLSSSVISVDVGGTSIKAAVLDREGAIVRRLNRTTPVDDGPAAVLDAVRHAARELMDPDVVAAGIVVPGSVDVHAGIARYSANLRWSDVPLRDIVAEDLGLPVVLEHDVRAAGLAEHTLGRARGVNECLVLVIGTGIAGVVLSGGSALRGATDLAGEIGHASVYPDGDTCACGQRGCLETYASAAAIARRYHALCAHDAALLTAGELAVRRASDPLAKRVWSEAVDALAIALGTYTMLLDPELVVLSGGLAEAGDALLEPLRHALDLRLTWRTAPTVEVSPLAGRAGQLGAAILAWQAVGHTNFESWTA